MEPAVVVSMRRPADMLVDSSAQTPINFHKVAWDVKVINVLGADHVLATLQSPLAAADAYRLGAMERVKRQPTCAQQKV